MTGISGANAAAEPAGGALQTAGISLPRIGLGTWGLTGAACQAAVETALALGYRHIDTGDIYGNEEPIGRALSTSGLGRDTIHVTTKAWHDRHAPHQLAHSLQSSLERLALEYVDLYMIHWPAGDFRLAEMVDAMREFRDQGLVRAMGVCNFPLPLLREAVEVIGAPVAAVQVEYHLMLDQSRILGYLQGKGIPLVAFCPLAQGKVLDRPEVKKIAAKHGVSATQVALAWLLGQESVAVIPKSGNPANQRANLAAAIVMLDDEDRADLAGLPRNLRIANPPFAPAWDD